MKNIEWEYHLKDIGFVPCVMPQATSTHQ